VGKLRVEVGSGPLRTEHERLLRTALRRGDKQPEPAEGTQLEGEYDPRAVELARRTWLERMVHEHHSAAVFSRLLPQLMAAEAPLEYKSSVLRMSMDELRHAGLCGAVVELLGGEAEVETDLETRPLPHHAGCAPLEIALRNVMFVGCMSETIALALLTEERELTTEPPIHAVVDQLAADEVLHARLGWSYLAEVWPGLDDDARRRTDAYLPVAFGYLEERMYGAMPLAPSSPPDDVLAHMHALGCLDSAQGRELFEQTVREVVVPRLAEHGLDASAAWRNRRRP